jgi:futalosine hydrolase
MGKAYPALQKRGLIGLISAVPAEGELLVKTLKNARKRMHGHVVFYQGKILGRDIVYAISGMGKTNAAHSFGLLMHHYSPFAVINFGVGGAYPGKGLHVGDIAVATKEVYADQGVLLKNGFHPLDLTGIPLVHVGRKRLFNEFPLDKRLGKAALKSSRHIASAKSGIFTTVSLCTGTLKRATALAEKFGAVCENMEGAAIAQLCCLYGTPCAEMRGISNIVENRDTSKWDVKLAAENCQRAVLEFLSSLG